MVEVWWSGNITSCYIDDVGASPTFFGALDDLYTHFWHICIAYIVWRGREL